MATADRYRRNLPDVSSCYPNAMLRQLESANLWLQLKLTEAEKAEKRKIC